MAEPTLVRRRLVVASLSIVGVCVPIPIVLILAQPDSEALGKLAGTCAAILAFLAFWLLSSMSVERGTLPAIGIVGMLAAPLALLFVLLLIWGALEPSSFEDLKAPLAFATLALFAAWASAVAATGLRGGRRGRVAAALTVGTLSVTAVITIVLVLAGEVSTGGSQAVTTLQLLATGGTFATPLLNKLDALQMSPTPPPLPPPPT